jgi:hypothetical protein
MQTASYLGLGILIFFQPHYFGLRRMEYARSFSSTHAPADMSDVLCGGLTQ